MNVKRYIDIEISKNRSSIKSKSFDLPLLIVNDPLMFDYNNKSTQLRDELYVLPLNSIEEAETYFSDFDTVMPSIKAYFMQDPDSIYQPKQILVVNDWYEDLPPCLILGDNPTTDLSVWRSITNGGFCYESDRKREIVELDFSSVQSMAEVGAIICQGIWTEQLLNDEASALLESAQNFAAFKNGRFVLTGKKDAMSHILTAPTVNGVTDISTLMHNIAETNKSVPKRTKKSVQTMLSDIDKINDSWSFLTFSRVADVWKGSQSF
ncbi:MAG: hypothetical protein OMM_00559 [Candidatus Magnetoglobus multicellularis str. Araruama]|uniref:Uncharacterized protein n=1 Tax=Candidatus Magnetoglobus multicellularis str. Araruama TaxID=890399 RepID=A0A1V1PGU5_9BACT|nr:MAG: hypothetical protein OMM_00559 [Candidatus Magnetoglobus multicellularis str. Araruama]